jgi:hypothetical protein
MPYTIIVTPTAQQSIDDLDNRDPLRFRKVVKTLALLAANPRHPGLKTHAYTSISGPNKEKVFEAYVENNTAAAYRIFFYYGPLPAHITVFAVTPHP